MELLHLYEIAANKNIYVKNVSLEFKTGFCFSECGIEAIGIDYSKANTEAKEKSVLAEELSHLHYGLTYHLADLYNPIGKQNAERIEQRALKYTAIILVPFDELQTALELDLKELWELADYFNVSETIIIRAIEYYKAQMKI